MANKRSGRNRFSMVLLNGGYNRGAEGADMRVLKIIGSILLALVMVAWFILATAYNS
jgi:hypothetical protein